MEALRLAHRETHSFNHYGVTLLKQHQSHQVATHLLQNGTWSRWVYKASHHEELILMSAVVRVLVMIDEATLSKLEALPLSDNT